MYRRASASVARTEPGEPRVRHDIAGRAAAIPRQGFTAGFDDLVIVPLAATVYAVRSAFRAVLRFLVRLLDVSFPILLQIARFPLFTLRIIGDGLAALAHGIILLLPVGGDRRARWREYVGLAWIWLRARISYKAFEEAVHHLFEDGMAWVFRTCRTLSPGAALLVLLGAIVWLPVSFALATGMHAILFAKAAVWPAWMQLLHPFATLVAKSKLLVLPAYPAAWPQAKNHPVVQTLIAAAHYLAAMLMVRKFVYRYRQAAYVAWIAKRNLVVRAEHAGAGLLWRTMLSVINNAAAVTGARCRRLTASGLLLLSSAPLLGDLVRRFAAHYEAAEAGETRKPEKFSDRVRGVYDRWSVKLSAEYYELRDREKAEAVALATPAPSQPAAI